MMKSMFITLLFLFAFVLSSCTTTSEIKGPQTDVGLWEGRVLVTNPVTKKNKWAHVVWASDSKNDRMKINVSAVFNYPVATFLKNGEEHDLWLYTDKKHFRSQDGSRLFYHLVKIPVDPQLFFSLLGKPQSPGPNWSCQQASQQFSCVSEVHKIRLNVSFSHPDKRRIQISTQDKTMQLNLSRSKVQLKESLFQSQPQSQFKTIKI